MYDWNVLNQAVSAELTGGRVGTPVFVRWTAATAASNEELAPLLAQMSAYTDLWLASSPRKLYAGGSELRGHLSLALEYVNGSSALLAIALAHSSPSLDLAVYGSDGAIYHNDAPTLPRQGSTADRSDPSAAPDLLAALERSLAANQPVSLSEKGD